MKITHTFAETCTEVVLVTESSKWRFQLTSGKCYITSQVMKFRYLALFVQCKKYLMTAIRHDFDSATSETRDTGSHVTATAANCIPCDAPFSTWVFLPYFISSVVLLSNYLLNAVEPEVTSKLTFLYLFKSDLCLSHYSSNTLEAGVFFNSTVSYLFE